MITACTTTFLAYNPSQIYLYGNNFAPYRRRTTKLRFAGAMEAAPVFTL